MRVLAIDLGGTLTKHCLIDENAQMSEHGEVPSATTDLAEWKDVIANIYAPYKGKVDGVTLSLPGMLNPNTGELYTAGAFFCMIGQNVFALLKDIIDVPLTLENDGKCGALAEAWRGALSDVDDGIVVIIGTGLAGGIIKNKRLHSGAHFAAGEISYMLLQPGFYDFQNIICVPGGMMGLMGGVAAAKGIDLSRMETTKVMKDARAQQLGYIAPVAPAEESDEPIIDGRTVFRWLEEGDPAVAAVYQRFTQTLGLLCHNLQVTYDPEKIAIGGGVSRQARLLPDIQAEVNKIGAALSFAQPPIAQLVPCQYLADANLVGAMYNFLIRTGV